MKRKGSVAHTHQSCCCAVAHTVSANMWGEVWRQGVPYTHIHACQPGQFAGVGQRDTNPGANGRHVGCRHCRAMILLLLLLQCLVLAVL